MRSICTYDAEFSYMVKQILKLNLTEKSENNVFEILDKCSLEIFKLTRNLIEEYKNANLNVSDVLNLSERAFEKPNWFSSNKIQAE